MILTGIVNNKLILINLILKADLGPIELMPLREFEEGAAFHVIRFRMLRSGFTYRATFIVVQEKPTSVGVELLLEPLKERSSQGAQEERLIQERLTAVMRIR